MNVCQYLFERGTDERRETLITASRSYTRGELLSAVEKVAAALIQAGLCKGMPVLLLADNSFFWVVGYLAVLKTGAVAVPLSPTLEPEDLAHIACSTNAKLALVQAKYALPLLNCIAPGVILVDGCLESGASSFEVLYFDRILSGSARAETFEAVDPNSDLAAIMFTSGSTGQPRGVMVSHRNITANTDSILAYLELQDHDRIMVVLPFYYCFGTSLLHTHLRAGGSLVLDHRFMFPDKVLQRMVETGCTGFAGVPSHYQILLRNSSLKTITFPKLKYIQQAGGNLAPTFLRELRESLPSTTVFVMYGQTEATARLSYLPPRFLDTKPGSVGKGIPGVRLAVLDHDGSPVHPGEVGEIVAAGDNVTLGYWGDPQETAVTFRNGQLYTGDLATVDEDGFFYIVDRTKDFLKCGGNRVSCQRVEEMLLRFPDLIEAAVIGVPDGLNGEAVQAFVVAKPGVNSDPHSRLRRFCIETFPSHLVPRDIVFVASLPKNSAGKVARAALKGKRGAA